MEERRKFVRYRVSLAVEMHATAVGVRGGTLGNISFGGAFIETRMKLGRGARIWVVVQEEKGEPESLAAVVCYVCAEGVGIEWMDVDARRRAYLDHLMGQLTVV